MTASVSPFAGGAPHRATPTPDRLPPHSDEAEAGVLGCCLLGGLETLDEACLTLPDPAAFFDLKHRAVFQAMLAVRDSHAPLDLVTVYTALADAGQAALAPVHDLNRLADAVPSAANLPYYTEIVAEKWLLRRWLAVCARASAEIHELPGSAADFVGRLSADLFALCESGVAAVEKSMAEIQAEVTAEYFDKFVRGVPRRLGPTTGFAYLDNIVPGFGPGQLVVMAARPRTGKSAILMQMAAHIAACQPVGFFSLEMTGRALGARAVFERGRADMTKFLNGFMANADVERLVAAQRELSALPITFDESPSLSVEDLEIRARRMVRRHGIKIIFLDYFQMLWSRNRIRSWNQQDELAHCSKRLKGLARELKLPIVLAAQMNREIEKETHRRPRLSDLRDTGQLEQDADVVLFLWKPDVKSDRWQKQIAKFLPRLTEIPPDWIGHEDTISVEGGGQLTRRLGWNKQLDIVTCTVEKQREGRSGEDATLVFIKPWTRFVDAYRPDRDPDGDLRDTGAPREFQDPDADEL